MRHALGIGKITRFRTGLQIHDILTGYSEQPLEDRDRLRQVKNDEPS